MLKIILGTGDVPGILAFYNRRGFEETHRVADYFTMRYDHPIVEDGVLLKDKVYLARQLRRISLMDNINIISIREHPEYIELLVNYLSSKWGVSKNIYQESERGKSLSARLLEHGRTEAATLNFPMVYLRTDHVGYYEKYGWRSVGQAYSVSGDDTRIYEIESMN